MRWFYLLSVLLIPAVLLAQFGYISPMNVYSPAVNDARARAMGRTEILNNNGPSAIGCNPAHLALISHPAIQLFGRFQLGTVGNDYQYYESFKGSYPQHLKFTGIAFAYPLALNNPILPALSFTAGIAYNTYLDYGSNYASEYKSTEEDFTTKIDREIRGGLHTISPAAAFKVWDKVRIGFAFHQSVFSGIYDKTDYNYIGFNGTYSPYDYQESNQDFTAHFFSFGQIIDLTPSLKLGMIYRSEFRMKFKKGKHMYRYVDGDEYEGKLEAYDMFIPAFTGIGLNYQAKSNILLSIEYQTRPFAGITYYLPNYYWSDSYYDKQYSGSCWRAGAEFSGKIVWRMGLFADNIFAYDSENNLPKRQYGFTCGNGFEYLGALVDLFCEISTWSAEYSDTYRETFFTAGVSVKYQF
ncbi:outer membrane protein transport protein [bacterium]|nr:outer membrane protein transport protein [bacterium]